MCALSYSKFTILYLKTKQHNRILKTQRIPRADYDKDLVEQRNNVLKEELKNLDPKNPSLKTNETETQNLERKNNLQQNNNNNLEDALKNLRERVGK